MVKRYGFGEFERKDVEVPNSAWDMRHKLLCVIKDYRGDIFRDLLLPSRVDPVVLNRLDRIESDFLNFVCISKAYGKSVEGEDHWPDTMNSPFFFFVSYLERKSEKIIEAVEKVRLEPAPWSDRDIGARAISKVIGKWDDLRNDDSASSLCNSLCEWASSRNLNESWIVEFAIIVLKHLKVVCDPSMAQLSSISQNRTTNIQDSVRCGGWLRHALTEAVMEHHSERVIANLFRKHDLPEFPPFKFEYGDFVMPSSVWFPHINKRSSFTRNTLDNFDRISDALASFDSLTELNENAYRQSLLDYCDNLEKNLLANKETEPYTVDYLGVLTFHTATWHPSKIERTDFIENYIDELKLSFADFKRMAKSLDSKSRSQLDAEIYSYCNKIERMKPESYKRTPKKYSDNKHFIWLISFQVPPFKTFAEIAASQDEKNRISSSGIKKAIKRLADFIGITLRTPPRTGRPRGIKESNERRVVG